MQPQLPTLPPPRNPTEASPTAHSCTADNGAGPSAELTASPPLSYLTYAPSIPVAGLVGSFPAGSVCVPHFTPPAAPVGMWCLLCMSGSFEGPCPVAPLGHSTWTGKIVVVVVVVSKLAVLRLSDLLVARVRCYTSP